MTDEVQERSLEALRKRWEFEKTPQLALQLAEEYRRRGDLARAIEVQREGLEEQPGHVSARVALGRYLIEAGEASEARPILEQVAGDDPTHLVANKLLVRTYLELHEPKEARDRLDLYTLLNESDPEIEELEELLAGHPAGESSGVGTDGAAASGGDGDPFASPWGRVGAGAYWEALEADGIFAVRRPAAETFASPPDASTVTLGRLYFHQGHHNEAARVFREVLEREPANVAARVGLAATEAANDWPVTALDLVPAEVFEHAAPAERRQKVLTGYLERLRA